MGGKSIHGHSYAPEYRAWQTMRLRCTVPTNRAWKDYGGRGITVCERWLNSVSAFVADMGPKPTPKHELDRIDNSRGYTCGKCPDCEARGATPNCRWVTRTENCRNRRSNRWIEYRGERRTLAEWCELFGQAGDRVSKRIDQGWSVARALETPAMRRGPVARVRPDTATKAA